MQFFEKALVNEVGSALKQLPQKHVVRGIGYGSRILLNSRSSQLDLLVVVDSRHIKEWHAMNLEMNESHYSFITKALGIRYIDMLQKMGPGLYYNPYAEDASRPGQYFKYGVISTASYMSDLLFWKHLYVAGRLHKPTISIKGEAHDTLPTLPYLLDADSANLHNAVVTALLVNTKEVLTQRELFYTISNLSYSGDIRSGIVENTQSKAKMFVDFGNNYNMFKEMYREPLKSIDNTGMIRFDETNDTITKVEEYRPGFFVHIPKGLIYSAEQEHYLMEDEQISKLLTSLISKNVKWSSTSQALKGLITGGGHTFRYLTEKAQKWL